FGRQGSCSSGQVRSRAKDSESHRGTQGVPDKTFFAITRPFSPTTTRTVPQGTSQPVRGPSPDLGLEPPAGPKPSLAAAEAAAPRTAAAGERHVPGTAALREAAAAEVRVGCLAAVALAALDGAPQVARAGGTLQELVEQHHQHGGVAEARVGAVVALGLEAAAHVLELLHPREQA